MTTNKIFRLPTFCWFPLLPSTGRHYLGFVTIISCSVVSALCPNILPCPGLLLGYEIHLRSWLSKPCTLVILTGAENVNITFLRHYYFSICHILHFCGVRLLYLIYFSDLLLSLTVFLWFNCWFNICIHVSPRVPVCLQLFRIRWCSCLGMCRGPHFSAIRDMLVPTCHLSLLFQPERWSVNIKRMDMYRK